VLVVLLLALTLLDLMSMFAAGSYEGISSENTHTMQLLGDK
jgi:hypothetical protein